jgi:general secretion pathway protein B
MSYILDALKKADAERERSPVPGLNAHDGGFGIADRRDGPPWRAIAIGTVVLLATLLAWLLWGRADTAPSAPPTPMPVTDARGAVGTPTPMPPPAAAPVPLPLADGSAPVPPAARALPAAGAAPAVPAVAAALPPPRAPTSPAPSSAGARPAAPAVVQLPATGPAPTPAPTPAPAPARPGAPGAEPAGARVPTRNELPADLRAALPPINVSGAVYAPQPAGRMLFANGLVLREGDAVADGLTVERIGATSSVLVFRGQRFELPH